MTRDVPRRRLRVRRRRKGRDENAGADVGVDVVAEFGCCLVEAVVSATVVIGLLIVPASLLLS